MTIQNGEKIERVEYSLPSLCEDGMAVVRDIRIDSRADDGDRSIGIVHVDPFKASLWQ